MQPHSSSMRSAHRRTSWRRVRWPRLVVIAVGLAAACVDRTQNDDDDERRRRCSFISFESVDAEGNRRYAYTDDEIGHTPQLCTCSTDEESEDFSEGGYREYVNELAFEECKRISASENYREDNCQELYEINYFGLIYGKGPIPPNPPPTEPYHEWETPLCGEDDNANGCGE